MKYEYINEVIGSNISSLAFASAKGNKELTEFYQVELTKNYSKLQNLINKKVRTETWK